MEIVEDHREEDLLQGKGHYVIRKKGEELHLYIAPDKIVSIELYSSDGTLLLQDSFSPVSSSPIERIKKKLAELDQLSSRDANELIEKVLSNLDEIKILIQKTEEKEALEGLTPEGAIKILKKIEEEPKLRPFIDYLEDHGLIYTIPLCLQEGVHQILTITRSTFYIYNSSLPATSIQRAPVPPTLHLVAPLRFPKEEVLLGSVSKRKVLGEYIYQEYEKAKNRRFQGLSQEIGDHLVRNIQRYIYFSNETDYLIVAAWVLGTYLWPAFHLYPFLVILGGRETGKSTLLALLRHLVYNPLERIPVSPTEAPLFRLIERRRPTLLVDEAQFSDKAIQAIFEAGYKKGTAIIRCDKEKPEEIYEFKVYCPKAIAGREIPSFLAKGIQLLMERAPKGKLKEYSRRGAELVNKDMIEDFVRLSAKMVVWALFNVEKVREELEKVDTGNLTGRAMCRWRPLLAITKLIWPERFDEVLRRAEELERTREPEDLMEAVENAVISVLLPQVREGEKTIRMSAKELRGSVGELLGLEIKPQILGSAINNLNITYKKRKTASGTIYYLKTSSIKKRAEEREISLEEKEGEDLIETRINERAEEESEQKERLQDSLSSLPLNKVETLKNNPEKFSGFRRRGDWIKYGLLMLGELPWLSKYGFDDQRDFMELWNFLKEKGIRGAKIQEIEFLFPDPIRARELLDMGTIYRAIEYDPEKEEYFLAKFKELRELMRKEKEGEEGEAKLVRVRFLDDVPQFVGTDLHNYGPFKANQIGEIPEENARALAGKGLVEILEGDEDGRE